MRSALTEMVLNTNIFSAVHQQKTKIHHLGQQKALQNKRIPGKLKVNKRTLSSESFENLISMNSERQIQNDNNFREMENIITSLLSKNDQLKKRNDFLLSQNKHLKNTIKQLQKQINILTVSPAAPNDPISIMSYFSRMSKIPIVQPFEISVYDDTPQNMSICKQDCNSNIRAFYLSMLQFPETRRLLHSLVCEYQNDYSCKLLPLLSTNQTWVQLCSNFFKNLENRIFDVPEDVYSFVNESQIYDIIFISALKSKIQYLGVDQDSHGQTLQIYTALANIFIYEDVRLQLKQSQKYDLYTFVINNDVFSIYYIEDINRYVQSFNLTDRVVEKLECLEQLQEVQSYTISTPLSTSRKQIKRKVSHSQPSSAIKKRGLVNQRYRQQEDME